VWERFSYYGMRALLVLYLTQRIFVGDTPSRVLGASAVAALYGGAPSASASPAEREKAVVRLASRVYGSYTALVYLTPLAGGLLADRKFGQRRMVLAGGALMAAGHAAMTSEALTFVGLLLIALGNGAFKPNISTQVGRLYTADATPARRDAAFSAFYVGINVGAAASPLVTGSLLHAAGFGAGFAAAGVGMCVGLAVVRLGAKHLPPDATHLQLPKAARPALRALLQAHRARCTAILALAALNIVFWATYEQQGDSLALFIEDRVARGAVPSSFFQSLNPAFILLLTPPLNAFWRWQARRDAEPHQITKMAIGCALLAASYLLLSLGCAGAGDGRTPAGWVVLHLLVLTLGELYLSPVGLSFVTQAAPPELGAVLMGVWFLSSFFGNFAAGALGARYADVAPASFWLSCAALGAANAGALMAARRPIRAALASRE
jgi:POT family proton-dependent oligopeptide transporter